jgi:hypothetical protein
VTALLPPTITAAHGGIHGVTTSPEKQHAIGTATSTKNVTDSAFAGRHAQLA